MISESDMLLVPIRVKFFRIIPVLWIVVKQQDRNNNNRTLRNSNSFDIGSLGTHTISSVRCDNNFIDLLNH